jgi:primosomal protein N'
VTIARVQPLTRTRAVRGPFDYRLGAEHADVAVGSLLRVPFGAQRTLGVVVELADRSELDPDRLAEPEAVLGAGLTRPVRRHLVSSRRNALREVT